MAENTTTTAEIQTLLDKANHALFRASETLSFIRKCLDKGPALDEPDIDGLNNILECLHEGLLHRVLREMIVPQVLICIPVLLLIRCRI